MNRWEPDRIEELELLFDLLQNVSHINGGNHFIENIEKCIEIADKLQFNDIRNCRDSFKDFLSKLCCDRDPALTLKNVTKNEGEE